MNEMRNLGAGGESGGTPWMEPRDIGTAHEPEHIALRGAQGGERPHRRDQWSPHGSASRRPGRERAVSVAVKLPAWARGWYQLERRRPIHGLLPVRMSPSLWWEQDQERLHKGIDGSRACAFSSKMAFANTVLRSGH